MLTLYNIMFKNVGHFYYKLWIMYYKIVNFVLLDC